MSHFSIFTTCRLSFANGYSISFDEAKGLGTLFCTLRYQGEQDDIGKFMTEPGKSDGFLAYLTPEEFAKVIYRISGESGKI